MNRDAFLSNGTSVNGSTPIKRSGVVAPRRTTPLFNFDLGGVSCYCMQSVKAGPEDEFMERREKKEYASYTPDSTSKSSATGSRAEVIARTPSQTLISPPKPPPSPAESGKRIGFLQTVGEKVESILHLGISNSAHEGRGEHPVAILAVPPVELHPLVEAVLAGRLIEAYRMIASGDVKDPSKFIDHKALDRLRRLVTRFDKSLKELRLPTAEASGWISERGAGPIFALRKEGNRLKLVSVSKHLGSPLLAFAVLCEVDSMESGLEVQVIALSERCDESLWLIRRGQSRQEELIESHCANALQVGQFLWVSRTTVAPEKGAKQYHGVPFPRAMLDYSRVTAGEHAVFRIDASDGGFTLTVSRSIELSQVRQYTYGFTLPLLLRRRFREETSAFASKLEAAMQRPALSERMRSSGRAAFYEQIRRQLEMTAQAS